MKTVFRVFFILILFPSITFAGEIYGRIRVENRYIEEGIKIEIITSDNQSVDETNTGKRGSYRLFVKDQGKYTLRLNYHNELR